MNKGTSTDEKKQESRFLFSLISRYCHRTGKWSREISAPLYRLRLALSRLWLLFRPHPLPSLTSE
jgi:hypothetical protein